MNPFFRPFKPVLVDIFGKASAISGERNTSPLVGEEFGELFFARRRLFFCTGLVGNLSCSEFNTFKYGLSVLNNLFVREAGELGAYEIGELSNRIQKRAKGGQLCGGELRDPEYVVNEGGGGVERMGGPGDGDWLVVGAQRMVVYFGVRAGKPKTSRFSAKDVVDA